LKHKGKIIIYLLFLGLSKDNIIIKMKCIKLQKTNAEALFDTPLINLWDNE